MNWQTSPSENRAITLTPPRTGAPQKFPGDVRFGRHVEHMPTWNSICASKTAEPEDAKVRGWIEPWLWRGCEGRCAPPLRSARRSRQQARVKAQGKCGSCDVWQLPRQHHPHLHTVGVARRLQRRGDTRVVSIASCAPWNGGRAFRDHFNAALVLDTEAQEIQIPQEDWWRLSRQLLCKCEPLQTPVHSLSAPTAPPSGNLRDDGQGSREGRQAQATQKDPEQIRIESHVRMHGHGCEGEICQWAPLGVEHGAPLGQAGGGSTLP